MVNCKICGKELSDNHLTYHIRRKHNIEPKTYYDTYIGKGFCSICGKETKFLNVIKGYAKNCSDCNKKLGIKKVKETKASFSEEKKQEIVNKMKQTTFERFGVESIFNREDVKKKIHSAEARKKAQETYKKTCLNKYGVDNYFKTDRVKQLSQTDEAKKKRKESFLNTTGVNSPMNIKGVKEKIQKVVKEKYGTNSYIEYLNNNGITQELKDCNIELFEKENNCTLLVKLVKEYGQGWYKAKIIDDFIRVSDQRVFVKNEDIEKIQKYAEESNAQTSMFEIEIADFLEKELNQDIVKHDRKTISPLELDIYIPSKNIAIECNGDYWHSYNAGCDINYHLNKTNLCKDGGIRLLHIFEHEWQNKKDICKSIISCALGIYENRIYARDCEVKDVNSTLAKQFLEENHIQGTVNSLFRLGLFYKNELVQLITIGKSRFKKDEYELLRMCTKLNTQVIGGFSKLMTYQPCKEIVSFIDVSKFNGNSYLKTGWEYISNTTPNYHYIKGNKVLNRISAQKHKLKDLLGEVNFDKNLTETENMIKNNWLKIYDCGNIKVVYRNAISAGEKVELINQTTLDKE